MNDNQTAKDDDRANSYEQRLKQQQEQYETGGEIHDLPEIFHYWSNKYLLPKMQAVLRVSTATEFYANGFAGLFRADRPTVKLVSIGSGDSSTEVEIAKNLISRGHHNFELACLEVNNNLITEANARIAREGLTDVMTSRFFDVNVDDISPPLDGAMANHSLHHIVELERLFSMIDDSLSADGRFLSMDMIGRNGHMRWPETLRYIEAIWAGLPQNKKYHHQLKQQHTEFLNFDCSGEGFEGIRAQDIMPLLTSRFSFKAFMGIGGLIDIFIDRGYGRNYSVNDAWDLRFIDFVEDMNDQLIELGQIKPTMLFAEMTKKGVAGEPRLYKNQTPQFCLRKPG